jgi:hypothetical protein
MSYQVDLFVSPWAANTYTRAMAVTGAGASAAGAVEDENKAYIVGRPLFKVPPSSPCRRANCARCWKDLDRAPV